MLTKVIFTRTSDLYYTKFLSLRQGTLVVPGPEIADLWREELLKAKVEFSTVTYADWIKQLSHEFALDQEEIVSKSELLDHFHRLWNNLGAEQNFTLFQYVFEIYTELKSITADQGIFKQILEIETTLNQEVILGLGKFYSLEVINDEYQILRKLITEIQASTFQTPKKRTEIHLFGFKILSALQLDLIQILSKVMNVYIYVPSHLDNIVVSNNSNEWPSWIKQDQVEILTSPIDVHNNSYLLCAKSDFISLWAQFQGKKVTILANSKELPLSNWGHQNSAYRFKTTSQSGLAGADYVIHQIQEILMKHQINWQQLKIFIEKLYDNTLQLKNDYPALKWLQFIKKWVESKSMYFESDQSFTWMDLGVLKAKIKLDAVRLFWQHYSESVEAFEINTLGIGVYYYPKEENIFLINESMQSGGNTELLSTQSSSILKGLGPSVSDDWHRWWVESLIYDYLGQAQNNLFVINEEALQFDLFLKNLLQEFNFIKVKIPIVEKKEVEHIEVINKAVRKISFVSPSALQLYKNCPKQYYVNYIEKLPVDEEYKVILTESKKGEIYHSILQEIGLDGQKLQLFLNNQDALIDYLRQHPQFFLQNNEAALVEIAQITQHTLYHWAKMPHFSLTYSNDWKIAFEQEFQSAKLNMKGRIDFFAYHEKSKKLIILDFKKSTVPNVSEIERYDHWQILCYLYGWREAFPDYEVEQIILGYWNLSSVEDSVMLSNREIPFEIPIPYSKIKCGWEQWELTFGDHWKEYLQKLKSEINYTAKPRITKICDYCILNNSCDKGILS